MAIGNSPAGMNIAEKYLQARQAGQVPSRKSVESTAPTVSNHHAPQQQSHTDPIGGRYKGRGSYVNIVV